MEWLKILEGPLASTPLAGVLGFAVWNLWRKLEAKDAEIQRLNAERVKDLIQVAARDDD